MAKCPICGKNKSNKKELLEHIEDAHLNVIPENLSVAQYVYTLNHNGRAYGICRACGKPTPWNENTGKPRQLCGNPKCKEKMNAIAKRNMLRKYGKTTLLNDAEHQQKMLANRRISGEYIWSDRKHKFTYTGSYEKFALEWLDKVMDIDPDQLRTPGPTIVYKFEGEDHLWITDMYLAEYNLIVEIKDGNGTGDKNTHPGFKHNRDLERAKDIAMKSQNQYNYIKLTNKNMLQLVKTLSEIRLNNIFGEGNESKKTEPIININESVELSNTPERLRIGVDIDNTMTDIQKDVIQKGIKWCNDHNKTVSKIHYDMPNPTSIFEFTDDEREDFDKIYKDIIYNSQPTSDCVDVLQKIKSICDIVIITARSSSDDSNIQKTTLKWLKDFNIPYSEIYFNVEDKGVFCKDNNIDIMIDDNMNVIYSCISNDIKAICPARLYNKSIKSNDKCIYCKDWYEIESMIHRIISSNSTESIYETVSNDDMYKICDNIVSSLEPLHETAIIDQPDIKENKNDSGHEINSAGAVNKEAIKCTIQPLCIDIHPKFNNLDDNKLAKYSEVLKMRSCILTNMILDNPKKSVIITFDEFVIPMHNLLYEAGISNVCLYSKTTDKLTPIYRFKNYDNIDVLIISEQELSDLSFPEATLCMTVGSDNKGKHYKSLFFNSEQTDDVFIFDIHLVHRFFDNNESIMSIANISPIITSAQFSELDPAVESEFDKKLKEAKMLLNESVSDDDYKNRFCPEDLADYSGNRNAVKSAIINKNAIETTVDHHHGKLYITSDLHIFGNASGIDKFIDINETKSIINNINSKVQPNDTLLILGDIGYRPDTELKIHTRYFIQSINCKNVWLVIGNHDLFTVDEYRELGFSLVCHRLNYNGYTFTHYPINAPFNIHGHLHNEPVTKYDNVDPKNKINVFYYTHQFLPDFEELMDDKITSNENDVINESIVCSSKDILYNKDKFDSGEINICFITGHSGSGKSTLGRNLSSDKIEHYELDDLLCIKDHFSMDNLKEYGNLIYSFFSGNGKKFYIDKDEFKNIPGSEYEDILIPEFIKHGIKYANNHKDRKFVFEGVEIFWKDEHGKPLFEPSFFDNYAFYIKGTSLLKSKFRAAKRDSYIDTNSLLKNGKSFIRVFSSKWKDYMKSETSLNKFIEYFKNKKSVVVNESNFNLSDFVFGDGEFSSVTDCRVSQFQTGVNNEDIESNKVVGVNLNMFSPNIDKMTPDYIDSSNNFETNEDVNIDVQTDPGRSGEVDDTMLDIAKSIYSSNFD